MEMETTLYDIVTVFSVIIVIAIVVLIIIIILIILSLQYMEMDTTLYVINVRDKTVIH
jgi:energy-converting hydrogenase Eha subunit H